MTTDLPPGGTLERFLRRTAFAAGLTVTHLQAMLVLRASPGLAMSRDDLAGVMSLTPAAGEELSIRLDALGLGVIDRAPPGAPPGRDDTRLRLTPKGKRLADKTLTQLRVAVASRQSSPGRTTPVVAQPRKPSPVGNP